MAVGKKLKASEQVRQKIVRLMTGKKLKASEQKLGGVQDSQDGTETGRKS